MMNIKNNKRRQDTLKKIENVFLELLKDRELSQIKVTAICEKAKINRGTFYANFLDVYDLADKIRERLTNEVNRLLEQELKYQYSAEDFIKLFEHIKGNQELYSFYFKLGYDNGEELELNDIYQSKYNINDANLPYHISFFKGGFNTIVKKWLNNNCKESPKQMSDILLFEYRGRFE